MTHRTMVGWFIAALTAAVLVAPVWATGAAESDEAEEVDLRFSWWGGESRHEPTLAAIDLYESENPSVTIEAEYTGWDGYRDKIFTQLVGRTAPDVFQFHQDWIPDIASSGMEGTMADLEALGVDISGFSESTLDQYCRVDGTLVALPTGYSGWSWVYNTDFFETFDVDADDVASWDGLLELGQAVHAQDPEAYLWSGDSEHITDVVYMYLRQRTGNQIVEADYTLGFTEADARAAMQMIRDWGDNYVLQPWERFMPYDGKAHENPAWQAGKIAMVWWPASYIVFIDDASPFSVDVTGGPMLPDAEVAGTGVELANVVSISADSDAPEAAAAFLNWFFRDPEAIKTLGMARAVPPLSEANRVLVDAGQLDPRVAWVVEYNAGLPGPPHNSLSRSESVKDTFNDIIQEVGYKRMTPAEAATVLVERVEEQVDALKQ